MTQSNDGPTDGTIDRRAVLRLTGSAAVAGVAFAGTASAHEPKEIRFCGCSQVCVDNDGESYRIIYATETDDGYTCSIEPATDQTAEREPGCFEAGSDEKVIGVLGGNRNVYWNPNNCARKALDEFSSEGGELSFDDCTGCNDDKCSRPVEYDWENASQHEYPVKGLSVVVRTRKCKPPAKWDDGSSGRGQGGGQSGSGGPD